MQKRILLVEDDPTCTSLLRNVIQGTDPEAEVLVSESAEGAFELLEPGPGGMAHFDLIVLDIFLSGRRTGIELWDSIRGRCRHIPILITSSLPLDKFFDSIGRSTIAPPFLSKPFFPGECRQVIEGLLASR